MTKNKIIAFAVAAVLGLATGSGFGLSFGRKISEVSAEMEDLSSDAQLSRFSALQFAHADAAHSREASLLAIDIVTKIQQARPDSILNPSSLPLAYGRLALSEERLGHAAAARNALDATKQLLHRPPHRDLTDEEAKEWVRKIDAASQNLP